MDIFGLGFWTGLTGVQRRKRKVIRIEMQPRPRPAIQAGNRCAERAGTDSQILLTHQ